jgi:hypothetical protein
MKKIACSILTTLGLINASPAQTYQQQEGFSGDTRLACEAILCLSTGQRPNECSPALSRYFSINHRRLSDTLRARGDFLNLCPAAQYDDKMRSLVNSIRDGAGRCDATSLNAFATTLGSNSDTRVISNILPSYCNAYTNNSYTDLQGAAARYVGVPERGGFWVEPAGYEKALREYNERIVREDEQARNN